MRERIEAALNAGLQDGVLIESFGTLVDRVLAAVSPPATASETPEIEAALAWWESKEPFDTEGSRGNPWAVLLKDGRMFSRPFDRSESLLAFVLRAFRARSSLPVPTAPK